MANTKSFTLVIPTDTFYNENGLEQFLRENDVYDVLNELATSLEYEDILDMLHDDCDDIDMLEYDDVVVCAYCQHDTTQLMQPDGICIIQE